MIAAHIARIAVHSSNTITQRYIPPQSDAIERAFAQFGAGTVSTGSKLDNFSGEPLRLAAGDES